MKPVLVKIGPGRDKDPTRTLTLRNRWVGQVNKRFADLRAKVIMHVGIDNALGGRLERQQNWFELATMAGPKYVYEEAPEMVRGFLAWLDQQTAHGVLEAYKGGAVGYGNKLWSDVFIQTAYQRGLAQARADLNSMGAKLPDLGPVYAAFNKPFHADRVALLYTRAFNGMKGVTDAMRSQMSHILAEGMAEGLGPYAIAEKLAGRIDSIGMVRARLIARTEIIRAHSMAALNEYAALEGIVGEEIRVQWWTALDERVRSTHQARHGRVYTRDVAMGLIGEPNCRCCLLPWTETIAAVRG